MNAERRTLEDRLYELQYDHEAAADKLEELTRENAELRQQLGIPGRTPRPRSVPQLEQAPTSPELSPPRIEEGDLTIPQIEIPSPGVSPNPAGQSPLPQTPPGGDATPPLEPGPSAPSPSISIPPAASTPPLVSPNELLDAQVTQLDINPGGTSGVDIDSQPGDDGVQLLLEPRTAQGTIVARPGAVSVVLLDYELKGDPAARVARWDLSLAEMQALAKDSPAGEGIRLELLWPEKPPEHPRLQLVVRYETSDHQYIEARRDVVDDLRSRYSQRWTPRAVPAAGQPTSPPRQAAGAPPRRQLAHPQWTPYR
jgi:hypothetical protein